MRLHSGFLFFTIMLYWVYKMASETLHTYLFGICLFYFCACALDTLLWQLHSRKLDVLEPRKDSYALITGASSGIGRKIAYNLAEDGFNVILVARRKELLGRMAEEMKRVHQIDAEWISCDLGSADETNKLLNQIEARKWKIDILINAAGSSLTKEFLSTPERGIEENMLLNMHAAVKLCRAIVPSMVSRGRGRVMNVSSCISPVSQPYMALYSAAKSFLTNFTRTLNYELRNTPIGVTCLSPGITSTEFLERSKIQQGLVVLIPGFVMHPRDVAAIGLKGMHDGVEHQICGVFNQIMFHGVNFLVPKRLCSCLCGIMLSKSLTEALSLVLGTQHPDK